jgi:hypothetical protein
MLPLIDATIRAIWEVAPLLLALGILGGAALIVEGRE